MTMHGNLHVLLRHAWVFSVDPRRDLFLRSFADLRLRNGTAPSSQCTMSTRMCTMSSNGQQPF